MILQALTETHVFYVDRLMVALLGLETVPSGSYPCPDRQVITDLAVIGLRVLIERGDAPSGLVVDGHNEPKTYSTDPRTRDAE